MLFHGDTPELLGGRAVVIAQFWCWDLGPARSLSGALGSGSSAGPCAGVQPVCGRGSGRSWTPGFPGPRAAGFRSQAGCELAGASAQCRGTASTPCGLQIHHFFLSPGLAGLTSGLRKSFPAAAPGAGHQLTRPATLCAAGKGAACSHTAQAISACSFHFPSSRASSCVISAFERGHRHSRTVFYGEAVVV